MSGFYGVYHRDGRPQDSCILTRMAESMAHRGPDGRDAWQKGAIGLGHCMLQTTPESLGEKLPFNDNDTGLAITSDARIDNREELAAQLGLAERLKTGIPDSQLILASYKKWGERCVDYLLGDFAFAIWDDKRQHLFCARDHLGIKPFYYHITDRLFVTATEVRAILENPDVPKQINEGRIADYLVNPLEGIDKTSTFYLHIFRLPPAHTMVISKQDVSISNYWELDPEYEVRFRSDEEYVDAFREIFTDAVHVRLRCNGQPASMLSGGIDSSFIVGVARELMKTSHNGSLRVYSGLSDNMSDCRETHFIRAVIRQGGLEPFNITPNEVSNYKNELQSVFDRVDEPFDIQMTLIMLIYLMASKNRNRVVLDGVEGDLVHSLSASYPAYFFRDGFFFRALKESNGVWLNYYNKKLSRHNVILGSLRTACIPGWLRRWRRKVFAKPLIRKDLKDSNINSQFADKVNIAVRLRQLRSHGCNGLCRTLREHHITNVIHPFLTVGLERYDRVAALCSVEPRHPLLDKRLVEYSVSLPWEQKVRNGWSKYQIRRAAKDLLPDEVIWRRGWEHVGWDFTSKWMKTVGDAFLQRNPDICSELNNYVDTGLLELIRKKGYNQENLTDESAAWTIDNLAFWLSRQQVG